MGGAGEQCQDLRSYKSCRAARHGHQERPQLLPGAGAVFYGRFTSDIEQRRNGGSVGGATIGKGLPRLRALARMMVMERLSLTATSSAGEPSSINSIRCVICAGVHFRLAMLAVPYGQSVLFLIRGGDQPTLCGVDRRTLQVQFPKKPQALAHCGSPGSKIVCL